MVEKESSLETKVEQIVRRSLVSKRSTKEIIDEIYSSRNHSLFFSSIREHSAHKRLFFLHRFDLFGVSSEMQLPYFYLTSIPKRREISESKVLQHVVLREVDVVRDGRDFLISFLGIPESCMREFEVDFMDILAYFTILFIRSNENLVKLVNAKNFDYKIMKSVLKDYKDTISFDEVDKELSEIFKGEDGAIDPIIKSKIEKMILQVVSGIANNIVGLLESSRKIIPNWMLSFHLSSRIWLSTILNKAKLTLKDYIGILDDLYMCNLIENKSTIFWCENCSLESPSYTEHHGRIAPSKITKSKCLNCGRIQSYSSIFSINELLRDAIFSKDGFLSVYFGWLLKKEEIPFVIGEYSSEYENDFIIYDNVLVECKMFRAGKDEIAIRSELENSLVQIEKHVDSLVRDGIQIEDAYLVWNRYEDPEELLDRFKTKHKDLFEKCNFEVFGPEGMEELISRLKEIGP